MPNSRLLWIDAAKAISILLVTMMHCTMLIEPVGINAPLLDRVNATLSSVRMPLFFAVAGVFSGSIIGRTWPDLFKRRVALLIWLLLVWTVARFLFVSLILPNPQNLQEGTKLSEIVYAFIEPRTGIWFLWSLALFYIMTKLLSDINRILGAVLAIAVSLIAMSWFTGGITQLNRIYSSMAYGNTLRYFPFFYIACCFPNSLLWIGKVRLLPWLLSSSVAFLILVKFNGQLDWIFPRGIYTMAKSLVGIAAMLFAARALVTLPLLDRVLAFIGRNTLPIYVAQVPVIIVLAYSAASLGAGSLGIFQNAVPPLLMLIVVVVTIGIQMLAKKVGANWLYQLPSSKRAVAYLMGQKRLGALFDRS